MKRSVKLVSLLSVAAFIVMALVPSAALAADPPEAEPAVISEVTLDVKTPVTGEAPDPANGPITEVAAFASASGTAEGTTDPGTGTRSAQQVRDGASPIEGAFSAAEIAWSAVETSAESRAALEAFEAETAYKAVVTLTLDSDKAALPESVSAETVNVTLGAPSGGAATRAAEPTITPEASNGKLVVTIEFPETAAAEPEPAGVPQISAVTLTGIVAPATGEEPEPPAGEIEDAASFASATGTATAEDGGAEAGPESREAAEAIPGAFSGAEIGWSAVDAAEDAAPVEKFEAETQYKAVVTLTVDTEKAALPEDVSGIDVKLSAGSETREANPEITAAKKGENTLEISIVFPATEKEADEPGTEEPDGWKPSEGQDYWTTAGNTWIQWYAGSSTMPYLQAGLTGPEKPDSITYEWSVGGSSNPIAGQTGSRLDLTSELLGTDFGIKTFSATVSAEKDGKNIEILSSTVRFSVLVAPADGITFFSADSPKPEYSYLVDYTSKAPTMSVSAIGETEGAELSYTWTDDAGKTVGTGKEFTPTAEQLGNERATKVFKCEVTAESSGQEVKTYNNPLAFTVEVYVNDLTVDGPRSVSSGQRIDITVSAPGIAGLSGKVVTTGLQVAAVTPAAGLSDPENVILVPQFGTTVTYTCRVTASSGQEVSFAVDKVTVADLQMDYSAKSVSWTATVSGSIQPSPTRPNTPVNPSPGSDAPIVPPPAVTAQPSPSPSAAPSGSAPAPVPSAAPSAPVQLAPDAPDSLRVEANPNGPGTILTGIDISTMRDTFSTSDLAQLIEVPEGGSVEVLDSDGSPALRNTRVATGMIVRVNDKDGQPIEQSVVVVPGDVNGTGLMNLSQVVTMAKALTGQTQLEGVYQLAGDLDGNGRITITDVVLEANMFVKLGLQE